MRDVISLARLFETVRYIAALLTICIRYLPMRGSVSWTKRLTLKQEGDTRVALVISPSTDAVIGVRCFPQGVQVREAPCYTHSRLV